MHRIHSMLILGLFSVVASAANGQAVDSLPDGPGKALVMQHCAGACHEMQRIQEAQGSRNEWVIRIRRMIRRGAAIPTDRIEPMAAYLAEALPPRVRAQAATNSLITTALGEVALRSIQTWVRSSGVLQADERSILATVSLSDASLLKVGQRVRAFAVGSRSSMHQARVEQVKVGQANAQVTVRLATTARHDNYLLEIVTEQPALLSIPNEAIIEEGERRVVYVRNKIGDFEPRTIQTGVQGELHTEVAGLALGEQVVTFGSFFIDAEYKMKSASTAQDVDPETLEALNIVFRGRPDPPHEGDNEIEVSVKGRNGEPVTNADIAVTYYMPAMASMNMPEMRNVFSLAHQADGLYSGHAFVSMSGTWVVTVNVSGGGKPIGKKEFTVIAK